MHVLDIKLFVFVDLYLLEFRMRQSVDDGIPAAGSLGEKNGNFRDDWVDERWIAPDAKHGVDNKRSPGDDPESDVHDGHFSSAHFSGKLLLFWGASEGSDVHFLCLGTERFLVIEDSSYDEKVAGNNDEDVEADNTGHGHKEALMVHILGEHVV